MPWNSQAALDLPRFCIQDGTSSGKIAVEEGIASATIERLSAMGHPLTLVEGFRAGLFGRGQIIQRDLEGVYWAGSDPRADGCAMPL